ncbi:hypothetical protein QPM17_00445 [Marinobacter sp. TBZ242]|uniref:Uncharacterized protein n=1 Tax=Marinobacter azerbaijanicus TaxID=3050455 RepID=A0ABT7I6C2_9GAMM|nr:hypothetical protein [Marinobacter sp. TBZ242]MDL0429580.1 hypothetical protein [Marinobacter sp. TBZ242]
MRRVRNFDVIPASMNDAWEWVCAIDSYDFNDTQPLADLIREGKEIPDELRGVIAQIIEGSRKPNKKAAAKLKIPARERMKVAGTVSTILGLLNTIKFDALVGSEQPDFLKPGVESMAFNKNQEPIDIQTGLEADGRQVIDETCEHFGISQESLENLIRALRKKITDWPNI